MSTTIKCVVVADKAWHSKENRILVAGDIIEFPAQVKNHEGKLVDFKVGDSFKIVEDEKPVKGSKTAGKTSSDEKPESGNELV